MGYYNYHGRIKQIIAEGNLTGMKIMDRWNQIAPAMVLFFDNHKPMPVREYRWDEYFILLNKK